MNKTKQMVFTAMVAFFALDSRAQAPGPQAGSQPISIEEAAKVISKGIGYQRTLNQMEMASPIPVAERFGTFEIEKDGNLAKITIAYFYQGTDEVFGLLSVEAQVADGGVIEQVGTVQFQRLQ